MRVERVEPGGDGVAESGLQRCGDVGGCQGDSPLLMTVKIGIAPWG